jgi:hypothetical protein
MPHSTLSHLSFIILVAALSIFWLRIGPRVNFSIFLKMGGIIIGSNPSSITFVVASSLWLKQHSSN